MCRLSFFFSGFDASQQDGFHRSPWVWRCTRLPTVRPSNSLVWNITTSRVGLFGAVCWEFSRLAVERLGTGVLYCPSQLIDYIISYSSYKVK